MLITGTASSSLLWQPITRVKSSPNGSFLMVRGAAIYKAMSFGSKAENILSFAPSFWAAAGMRMFSMRSILSRATLTGSVRSSQKKTMSSLKRRAYRFRTLRLPVPFGGANMTMAIVKWPSRRYSSKSSKPSVRGRSCPLRWTLLGGAGAELAAICLPMQCLPTPF